MRQITDAAKRQDVKALGALTNRASELEQMKRTVAGIEATLATFQSAVPIDDSSGKLRRLPIEVTQGMINQNLLTLTEAIKRGRIRVGEDLSIEARPSGDRFRTVVMQNGNKLQERGAIGKFYRDAGVHGGEFVVLTEVSPNQWTLEKAKPGEFQGRNSW